MQHFIEFDLHDSKDAKTVHVRAESIIAMRQVYAARKDITHTVLTLGTGVTVQVKATPEQILDEIELIALEEATAPVVPTEPTEPAKDENSGGNEGGNDTGNGNGGNGGNGGGRGRGGRQS